MKTKGTKRRSHLLRRFTRAAEAVSALEYAILVGVIAVGIGAALLLFEDNLTAAITALGSDLPTMAATVDGSQSLDSN